MLIFYGTAQCEIFVDLSEEEQDGEHCGLQMKSMYGAQDASALWQDDYTQVLENAMSMKGTARPALLHNESGDF